VNYKFFFFFLLLLPTVAFSQDLSNKYCKWFAYSEAPFELDKKTILPNTWEVLEVKPNNFPLDSLKLNFDEYAQKMSISRQVKSPKPDSIKICYQTFSYDLRTKVFHRSQTAYDSGHYENYFETHDTLQNKLYLPEEREELFSSNAINKSGSITRAISLGNQQDVFVNSSLNLQLEGQITDDLELLMIVSDQNVPFQPEGNTQQLQEFDKVLVQLKHQNGLLRAGNIILQNRDSHFLKYYKNMYGGNLQINTGAEKKNKSKSSVSVAIARGQFRHYRLEVQEGVQGAYRLRGANNEQFIIIQAASERVFLDGKLLKRGFNYDYTIDYNNAELTFNNNITITQFTRVRVEFEYRSQNYNRSILEASHVQNFNKLGFSARFYREKDNKNAIVGDILSDNDKQILANVGDSLTNAFSPTVQEVEEFTANRVLYTTFDTLVDSQVLTIYRRAGAEDLPLLEINFLDVGVNKGDYALSNPSANGRVYVWVGLGKGSYAPIRLLIAPNQKQVASFGLDYQLGKNSTIFLETAFSKQDKNLFSDLGNQDNEGFAVWLGYQNKGTEIKNISFLEKYKFYSSINYEFDDKNFTAIDRFRSVEFDRNWSATLQNPAQDQILNAQVGISKDVFNKIDYRFSHRVRDKEVNGSQHEFIINKKLAFLQVNTNFFAMENQGFSSRSEWQRLQTEVYLHHKKIRPGYVYFVDRNSVFNAKNDSIIGTANNFEEHLLYLQQGDSSKSSFRLEYAVRKDNLPQFGELKASTEAQTFKILGKKKFKHNDFSWNFTWRELQNLDSLKTKNETIMGRLDWRGAWFKNHIKSSLTFTTNTSREAQREFVFLEVNSGQGTHTWRDDNEDGVQDLGEFYIAINPDERNYAKIFIPNGNFIDAFSNDFIYQLTINTPRKWLKVKGLRNVLGRFSNVSSWRITKKITDDDFVQRFIPFTNSIAESDLLARREVLRSSLFFNRGNPKFGFELLYFSSKQKSLLSNGFESKNNQNLEIKNRLNLTKQFNLKLNLGQANTFNASDFLENRNYDITTYQLNPQLAWQANRDLRMVFGYALKQKTNENPLAQNEEAKINTWTVDFRYSSLSKRNIQAQFRILNIDFNAKTNTATAYQMLEALQVGRNYTWNLNIQQRLNKGLQLTFTYTGRKSQNTPIIHIGRMQLTALF
jgi:hypothetical protein